MTAKKKIKFTRNVDVSPAYDKRHPDPSQNYGVSACRIFFNLIGPKGAVTFQIGTDWYLPHVQKEMHARNQRAYHLVDFKVSPYGWDVGYHAKKPQYEGQSPMPSKCNVIGCKCYYDGSGLRADRWVPKFIEGGTDWLWPEMEKEYMRLFEGVEAEGE